MEKLPHTPEFELGENDRVLVIGAGGFIAEQLYLSNLAEMGVDNSQLTLVDPNEERSQAVSERYPGAHMYEGVDQALDEMAEQGKRVRAIFVASSTAAHADNIRSIVDASEAGKLDLSDTKIWCEKPVTPTEVFDNIRQISEAHPDFDLSVGYILRFSETLSALDNYLRDNELSVAGVEWIYGKDRTKDTRPTQGVFPDEVVHPLSVTDLVLTRAFGDVVGVDVNFAEINNKPFANPEVQKKARETNPGTPERPTSDVYTDLEYSLNRNGEITKIPVAITSSFVMDGQKRRVNLKVNGHEGEDVLTIDFDEFITDDEGNKRRADVLRKQDGTIIFESGADKSRAQIFNFLGVGDESRADVSTSLEGENRIQTILSDVGRVAVGLNIDARISQLETKKLETMQVVTSHLDESQEELIEFLSREADREYITTPEWRFSQEIFPVVTFEDDEVVGVVVTEGHGTANIFNADRGVVSVQVEPGSVILLKGKQFDSKAPWLHMKTADGEADLKGSFIMSSLTERHLMYEAEVMLDAGAKARRRAGERRQRRIAKMMR